MMTHAGTPADEHVPGEWRDKIMHASMIIGDSRLMASDVPPGRDDEPKGFHVSLHFRDVTETARIFLELTESGKMTNALEQTFWAARFSMCEMGIRVASVTPI